MKIKVERINADSLKEQLMSRYGIVYDHLDQISNSPDYSIKLIEIDKDALDIDVVALQEVLRKIKQIKGVKVKR